MAPLREEDGPAASEEEDPTVQATVGHRIAPLASPRPATGRRLPRVGEEDEPDEPGSITATATAPVLTGAPKLPIAVASRNVDIRAIEEELGDETEVRTLPGSRAPVPKPPPPPASPASRDDEDAPRIRISPKSLMPPASSPPPASRPPSSYAPDRAPSSRMPLSDAPTATRAPVPAEASDPASSVPDVYGEEEAVTTHGISLGSVPRMPPRVMPPVDPADPTTQRLARGSSGAQPGLPSAAPPFEEDDPHNRTAVMANAPMLRAAQNAAMAPSFQSEGSMRSGLPSGERLGAMPPRGSSASMRSAAPPTGQPPTFATAFVPPAAPGREDKPNYVILVAVVAAVSIVVPLLVFVVLNQSNDGVAPRVAAQPSPDFVKRADAARARGKAPAPAGSDEASAASASPSAKLRHR